MTQVIGGNDAVLHIPLLLQIPQRVHERFLLRIEAIEAGIVGTAPQVIVLVYSIQVEAVTTECIAVSRISLVLLEGVSVILAKPVPCGKPDKAIMVLHDVADIALG